MIDYLIWVPVVWTSGFVFGIFVCFVLKKSVT